MILDIESIKVGDIIQLETFGGLIQVGIVLNIDTIHNNCVILTDSSNIVTNIEIKYWSYVDVTKTNKRILSKLKTLLELLDVLYLFGLELKT